VVQALGNDSWVGNKGYAGSGQPWPEAAYAVSVRLVSEEVAGPVVLERRVTALELFFDLVFVFALTQVTTLMAADPTWLGLLRGMAVLTVLWWAWVGYVWIGTTVDAEDGVAASCC